MHNAQLPLTSRNGAEFLAIPGGLFHLSRLCQHVDASEHDEEQAIIESREQALVVAGQLLRTKQLSFDDVKLIRGWLGSLAAEHGEPKRDARKLRASGQFVRSRTRNEAGGAGIGQSAMLAYAAQRNLVLRRDDVRGILTHFNRRTIAVQPYITDAKTIINRVWRTLANAETSDGKRLRLSHVLARELVDALTIYVEPFAPFVECSVRAGASLRLLSDVLQVSGPTSRVARGYIEDAKQALRRMRMIVFLEEEVISRLVLGTGDVYAKGVEELDRAITRLERMAPGDYRTMPRNEVLALALDAREALIDSRIGLAAKRLKDATHLLAVQF